MQITPNEIDSIEEAGQLDKSPVKLIRTKGGFWLAVGRSKSMAREEALAAGSHPAIVKFNLQKNYPNYQPAMMKSEAYADNAIVEMHSHFLSEDLRKSGHDIYSVQVGTEIDFQITRHNLKVASVNGHIEGGALVLNNLSVPKDFSRALAGATVEKGVSCGASKVKVK